MAIAGTQALAGESPSSVSDITHGNIRCVLMSVGQITVFPNKEDHNQKQTAWGDTTKGVPCFIATYLVEQLGDGPPGQFVGGSWELVADGKPLRVGGAGYHKVFVYDAFQSFLDFGKPKVGNSKRTVILQSVSFGVIPNPKPVSLSIEAGFGQDIQKFQFHSIRLQ